VRDTFVAALQGVAGSSYDVQIPTPGGVVRVKAVMPPPGDSGLDRHTTGRLRVRSYGDKLA